MDDSEALASVRSSRLRVEVACAVLLSLGGVASTWCSYQDAEWSGVQASRYSLAGGRRTEASRSAALGGQQTQIDVAAFIAWSAASRNEQPSLREFLEHRFRLEFRPAFDEWLATDPMTNADAAPSPFSLPSYRVAATERAAALTAEADTLFDEGEYANHQSSQYMRSTVLFALALFFAGVAQQFTRRTLQWVTLGLSATSLLVGACGIVLLPRTFG